MDGGSGYRAEAERWLMISEKLLTARDVQGAKSFAIRARESDPRLMEFADQIIAVADTLLAGDLRVNVGGGESFDYYAILQIPSLTQSMDVIASQYRRLALLLNPNRNRLVYCDQAFNLVNEAWLVFSDPNKKAMYDHALQLSQLTAFGQTIQLGQYQEMPPQEPPVKKRVREEDGRNVSQPLVPEPTRVTRQPTQSMFPEQTGLTREPIQPLVPEVTRVSQQPIQPLFTEPPRVAPQQVTQPMVPPAPAPPPRPSPNPVQSTIPELNRPMQGASTQSKTPQVQQQTSSGTEPHRGGVQGNVAPSGVETRAGTQPSPVETEVPSFWTTCPYCFILYEYPKIYEDCALKCQKCRRAFQAVAIPTPPVTAGKEASFCCWGFFPLGGYGRANRGYKVIYEDEDYINLSDSTESDSSDDDWRNTKKTKTSKRKATFHKSMGKSQNERTKKVTRTNVGSVGKENMVALGEGNTVKRKGAGKLDLNVMFSNEADEAATGAAGKKKAANKVVHEDNMEGIGFFEGLDEFLSTLPILSVVGDDKVKAA